jgi:hypothetical protein
MQITRENYRAFDAVNYSKLSALSKDPKKVNEEKDWSDGLGSGDILDILCFDGEDAFHEKYYIDANTEKLPSETVVELLRSVESYDDEAIIQKAAQMNYGQSWKPDTLIGKVKDSVGLNYIKMLEESKGKRVIDYQTYVNLVNGVDMLKSDPNTKSFFENSEYQVPVTEELTVEGEPVRFKGLLDILEVTGDYNIVADLKYTSSSLKYFESDFIKWRYDLQSALYSDLISKYNKRPTAYFILVYSAFDSTVKPFRVPEFTISCGRHGGFTDRGRQMKGYIELTKEYLWHKQHDKWDLPYEIYTSHELELDPYRRLTENGSLIIRR